MFKNQKPLSKNLKIETNNPVPKRMAPRQLPGVYIIVRVFQKRRDNSIVLVQIRRLRTDKENCFFF